MASRLQRHQERLLALLPEDGATLGNQRLWERFNDVCAQAGDRATETQFQAAREALVEAGLAFKGKGRGGSTGRVNGGGGAPEFDLKASAPSRPEAEAPAAPGRTRQSRAAAPSGEPQVLSYRHPDRRVNNPEVGLVNVESDPEQPKTAWAYDPHLDPALQFDSAPARAERLIEDALAGDDATAMRSALEQLRRMGR